MHRPVSRGYNARPGTGQMNPPGTGMRPMSGRLGTGQQEVNYSGIGLNTNLNIADRPVTQQGMAGLRTATASRGRQIQDVSYFTGQLRAKITELQLEIQKLQKEGEQRRKDASQFQQLERKYENLMKDVRNLEGELADYNLATDKLRSNVSPGEILGYLEALKRRNQEEAREIDGIFLDRQERERGTERLEAQIDELHQLAESRMNSLSPDKLNLYKRCLERNKKAAQKVPELQSQLESVSSQIESAEDELSQDRYRDEYARLTRKLESLQREEASLEQELDASKMDPAAARERLLAKVKQDTTAIQQYDKDIKAMKQQIIEKKKTADELAHDIENRKGDAGEASKYLTLYQRDQEMTEFIDRFPEMKEKETQEQARARDTITALLEHVSAGIVRETNMPSADEANAMGEDLKHKEQELGHSKTTQQRLQDELTKREEELSKINTLDEKITSELSNLRERMKIMEESIIKFGDLESLRSQHEAITEWLEDRRSEYSRRRDLLQQQVQAAAQEYDRTLAKLESDSTGRALESQEKKMRTLEQTIYALKEFIASKGRDSEYRSVKQTVLELAQAINTQIQEAQSRVAPSITAAPY